MTNDTSQPALSALIVTYVWPPTGGVGSQRVRKLAKFLPEHGVKPSVLTVENPSVPLVDTSLLSDVPPDIDVIRVRTLEPSYASKQFVWSQSRQDGPPSLVARLRRTATAVARQALIPDPQVLWQPGVQRVLYKRLRAGLDDVVLISAPPFSTFLSAPLIRMVGRSSVVLDYRDEWSTLRTQYEMLSRVGALVGSGLERQLLRCAAAITVATDAFRDHLLSQFSFLDPARVVTIANGYDPDDLPSDLLDVNPPPTDRFVLTYAGTVFKQNSPHGLMAGLRLLKEREPELSRLLSVRFLGRIVDTELDVFHGSEALGVEKVGFVGQDEVRRALAASHMTLSLLDIMPGAERIYPAKTFELMTIGRPCLTIAPEGALTTLARQHHLGPVVEARDAESIANTLATALRQWRDGLFDLRSHPVDIDQFHRRAVAGRFANLFRTVRANPVA